MYHRWRVHTSFRKTEKNANYLTNKFYWFSHWNDSILDAKKVKVLVAQLCLTLCDLMDCSPLGSSIHGILQARMLEWVATLFSRGSSRPRDQTQVSCIAGRFFTIWATGDTYQKTVNKIYSEYIGHYSLFRLFFSQVFVRRERGGEREREKQRREREFLAYLSLCSRLLWWLRR